MSAASLATSVACNAHGHADVGLCKGWCIVDAITRHGNNVPLLLQGGHNAHLVHGGHTGVNAGTFNTVPKIFIFHVTEFTPAD